MCEHVPNVCVKTLLEELKLESHLEHLRSPRQFDRTEGYIHDLRNASDNAKLVTNQQEQIQLLNQDKKTLQTTIKNLESQIQLYKNEQKEGCKTLRVDEENGILQKRIVYQWSKRNGDVVILSEEELRQLRASRFITDESVVDDELYELRGNSGHKVKNIILVAADKKNTHNFEFEDAFDMFGEKEGVATVRKLDVPSYFKTVGELKSLCDTKHQDMVLNSRCRPVGDKDPVQTIIILSTEQHIQEEEGKISPKARKSPWVPIGDESSRGGSEVGSDEELF
jgi:hypothetical protein